MDDLDIAQHIGACGQRFHQTLWRRGRRVHEDAILGMDDRYGIFSCYQSHK
jgi:hypothetical protein